MGTDDQFRWRVLLVDGDTGFLRTCSEALHSQGYEVLTAQDGFAALHVLRGAHPDLVVAELNLPRMSGFELLSVVRTRFPTISVIALSDEYTPATVPHEAICDAFLVKGPNLHFELVEKAHRLISESPVRGSRAKPELAPVWIPRSAIGYIILTCPECLRSFSAAEPKPGPAKETCVFCGAEVAFLMSSVEVSPPTSPESPLLRAHKARAKAQQAIARSQELRGKPR